MVDSRWMVNVLESNVSISYIGMVGKIVRRLQGQISINLLYRYGSGSSIWLAESEHVSISYIGMVAVKEFLVDMLKMYQSLI